MTTTTALGYNTVVRPDSDVRLYLYEHAGSYYNGVEIDLFGYEGSEDRHGYLCMSAELARTIGVALIGRAHEADARNTGSAHTPFEPES